jgi:hypothetical protein
VVDLTDKATGGLAFPAGVIKIMDIMQTVTLDNEAGAHAAEIILSKRAVLAQVGPHPFLLRSSRSSTLVLGLFSILFFVLVFILVFVLSSVLFNILSFFRSFLRSFLPLKELIGVISGQYSLASAGALRQPHNLLEESCIAHVGPLPFSVVSSFSTWSSFCR